MSESQLLFDLQCLQKRTARRKFRKDIFDSWDGCAYCGRSKPATLDHVFPKSKGGLTVRHNLVASCADCNLKKSDLDFMEFFRAQEFWSYEREQRILSWVNQSTNVISIIQTVAELNCA